MHRLVPAELLGRVSSLDWLISTALVPVSFILTGPISNAIGVEETLIGAGLIGSLTTFAFLLIPGIQGYGEGREHGSGPRARHGGRRSSSA